MPMLTIFCFTLQDDQERARLQLEYELHSKITSATLKLSRDRSTNRSIRRQRKACHKQMKAKVRIQIALVHSRKISSQPYCIFENYMLSILEVECATVINTIQGPVSRIVNYDFHC